MIEAEWPKKMEIDRSDSVRISLVRTTEQVFVPTVEIVGHTVIVASPMPVGTPAAPIAMAFGPEYEALANATLKGAAFECEPLQTEDQSIDQPRITWEWNIIPKKPGQQIVNANIEIKWKPIGSKESTIQRTVWRYRLDILVQKPLIATGQLNVLSLAGGFVGSVLSIPWLYERVKERREKREREKEGKPKIYRP
jgi:hypothetical protein